MDKIKSLKPNLTAFAVCAALMAVAGTAEAKRLGEIRTSQYRDLQTRLCRGWNTWYNNSMTSHTFLPDGFTVNFGFALHNGKEYVRDPQGPRGTLAQPPDEELEAERRHLREL